MERIEFTLNGKRYQLSRDDVKAAMRKQVPGRIQVHAAEIEGVYFPVKQVIAQSLKVPKSEFISTRAQELIRKLGFPVVDTDIDGPIVQDREASGTSTRAIDATTRLAALELSVAHLSGGQADGSTVLQLAHDFETWLIGPSHPGPAAA